MIFGDFAVFGEFYLPREGEKKKEREREREKKK